MKCGGKNMMTDNYLDMKEILKFLIISSQIIYDHMEIIQYQPVFIYYSFICLFIYLFIYLFVYQSIYLIHNISPVSLCSVKACCLIKLPPVNLSPEVFS